MNKIDETIDYVLDQIKKEKTIYQVSDDGIVSIKSKKMRELDIVMKAVGSDGLTVKRVEWDKILGALVALKAIYAGLR